MKVEKKHSGAGGSYARVLTMRFIGGARRPAGRRHAAPAPREGRAPVGAPSPGIALRRGAG